MMKFAACILYTVKCKHAKVTATKQPSKSDQLGVTKTCTVNSGTILCKSGRLRLMMLYGFIDNFTILLEN